MSLKPILKWAGGKRQLLPELVPLIEELRADDSIYVEPFVGGGAVLFEIQPSKAIINDLNVELINVYKTVRDRADELIAALKVHAFNHCKEYYYRIRALDREENYSSMSAVERAARLLYLNRTCYNGLHRVNARGQFNVPFGRYKNPRIVDEQKLRAVGEYLRNNDVTICNEDYAALLARLDGNIFVYLDPPYYPLSASAAFTSYTEKNFLHAQQVELRDVCECLRRKNISFVESNSDCAAIRELYSDFESKTVRATRTLNRDADKRGAINEVVIYYRRQGVD